MILLRPQNNQPNQQSTVMKKAILSLTALVALAISVMSCGGGGTPKAAAEKFLNGVNHMDFASAKDVATEATKKQLDAMEQMMGMMGGDKAKDEAKKITVDVKEPVISGETATVAYTLSSEPGVSKNLKMVKQNGKWLAEWSKMDGMGGEGGAGGMGGGAGAGGMGGGATGGMNDGGMGGTMDTSMAPAADGGMMAPATGDTSIRR